MPKRPPPTLLDELMFQAREFLHTSGLGDAIVSAILNPMPVPQEQRVLKGKKGKGGTGTNKNTTRTTASMAPSKSQALYDLLQVSPTASTDVIKAAYRSLARLYHPDVAKTGNKAKFQAINHAHEILSDPDRRKLYDAQR